MASQSYTRLTLVALSTSGDRDEARLCWKRCASATKPPLATQLPAGTKVNSHARTTADVIDFAALTLANGGYAQGDPETAATWVVACCQAWLSVLRANPLSSKDLDAVVTTATTAGDGGISEA